MTVSRKIKQRKRNVLVALLSWLPWWLAIPLAGVAFYYLHGYAAEMQPFLAFPHITAPSQVIEAMSKVAMATLAQVAQYLVPAILVIGAGFNFFKRSQRKRRMTEAYVRQSLDTMSWHDFELFVADLFRKQGYKVQVIGGDGPDGGIDLVVSKNGERGYVQCKQWRAVKVGVDVVRQLYGVMAADHIRYGFVVTTGVFTEPAYGFAKDLPLELIDGDSLVALVREME